MKIIVYLFACSFFLHSCNNHENPVGQLAEKDSTPPQNFFPVTDYLKGEIYNIKKSGINPLKYTTVNGRTDSAWIKIEDLDSTLAEFLHPEIDSTNLMALFSQESFRDQSLDAVTFTYDATAVLPDSMKLKHWDVYVDPKTNKVKRVYLVKEIDKAKTLQLMWVSGQRCKITTIVTDANGVMKVEKEEKLIWDF
jgi:hypothetical protein